MPTAFVTGATGFLGRHIIDVLLEANWTVTAVVRNPTAAAKILSPDVTILPGDLTKPETIRKAMPDEVDCVFHAAADTGTWAKEGARQEMINIGGTATILQIMLDKEAKRLVHVSTVSVYGEHHGPITEETPRLGAKSWIGYTRSKSYAERKVKEAVERGLSATIVNPSHIIGRYDGHNWARLITMMANGTLPGTPPGTGNFANGREVAKAIVTAYHKGKDGENYILGGPKASFYEFLAIAAKKIGKGQPKKPMPAFVLKLLANLTSFVSIFTGKRPMVTREEAVFSSEILDVRSDKAQRDLGYKIIPLEQSIDECIAYLRAENLLKG
jgi:nucleoside-diphosphate-sugar epimerase